MRKLIGLFLTMLFVGFAIGCDGDSVDENAAPVIDRLIIPETAEPGTLLELRVVARDPDGDTLTYLWTVNDVPLEVTTAVVEWSVPEH